MHGLFGVSARFTFALQFLALECVIVALATLTKSITFTYSRDPNT